MSYMLNKYTIFCFFWVTLFSCVTEKKARKFLDKKPEFAAKECARRFPVKETTDTVTVIDSSMLQAYEMEFVYLYHIVDSLLGEQVNDSIKKEIVTVFQEKKVPVIKYKYITKTVENTAKSQVILDSCSKITNQYLSNIDKIKKEKEDCSKKTIEAMDKADRYKRQRNKLYWWILLLLLALFRKPLIRAAGKLVTKS